MSRLPFIAVLSILVSALAMSDSARGQAEQPVAAPSGLGSDVPNEVVGVGVDQKPGSELPLSVSVTDSYGHTQRLAHYFESGRPVLVTLNYSSCPMLCSLQLNQLVGTLNELDLKIGEDFDLLTLSIDPNETTDIVRETKKKYIQQLRNQPTAESGWHFVTAKQKAITEVTDALGFRYRYDKLTKEFYHPAMLAFVTPEGVVSSYSLDVAFPKDQMTYSIIDASDGKVGSVVDQFLMLCFRYDSERNKYVADAWNIMRLGGAFTVCLILVTLTPFWLGRKASLADANSVPLEDEAGIGGGEDGPAKAQPDSSEDDSSLS